jgi:hypothetical protein
MLALRKTCGKANNFVFGSDPIKILIYLFNELNYILTRSFIHALIG